MWKLLLGFVGGVAVGLAVAWVGLTWILPRNPQATPNRTESIEKSPGPLKEGKGKMTEAQVISLLGTPDHVKGSADGTLKMIWEEINLIEVEGEKGVVTSLRGRFSASYASTNINLERFRKLRLGMPMRDVEKVVDSQGGLAFNKEGDKESLAWERVNRVFVEFRDGVVNDYGWFRSFDN
jgi:hypothetical protein